MRLLSLGNIAELYDGRNPEQYICSAKDDPFEPVLYANYRDGLAQLVTYTGLPHPKGRTPKSGRVGMADHPTV